ncbi:MAG: nitrate/nitrite transporter NrtS [Wenzhouxiangella sp.]
MVDRHRPAAALRLALAPACLCRSLAVAVIVGTVLNAINQGDVLLSGGEVSWLKIALTYAVPFLVATYGGYSMARRTERDARPSVRSEAFGGR